MILRLPLLFKGLKDEKKQYALFDSGSAYSCIREDLAWLMGDWEKLQDSVFFNTAFGNQILEIGFTVQLFFELNEIDFEDDFMIVPGLTEEVIIGADTMQRWGIKLDFEQETIITDSRFTRSY